MVEVDIENLDQEFSISTDSLLLTYKVQKKEWFIFSGVNKQGKIVYQKTVKKNIDYLGDKGTPVFQNLRVIYPKNMNKKYGEYCKEISGSL